MRTFSKKIILINLSLCIFIYFILEILTGSLIYKNKLDCHYLQCNRTYVYENTFKDDNKVIYKKSIYNILLTKDSSLSLWYDLSLFYNY